MTPWLPVVVALVCPIAMGSMVLFALWGRRRDRARDATRTGERR